MQRHDRFAAFGVTVLALAAACAPPGAPVLSAHPVAPRFAEGRCDHCTPLPISTDSTLVAAIGARIVDLKARGGDCEAEADVLDRALASGHITLRPYMWRVDGNLASAQGESSGELMLALDIDSLNIGVRALDDVLRSAEHEAAHIAFRIPSGTGSGEALVNEHVTACRVAARTPATFQAAR